MNEVTNEKVGAKQESGWDFGSAVVVIAASVAASCAILCPVTMVEIREAANGIQSTVNYMSHEVSAIREQREGKKP